ncbi:MAG TPA: NUDIX hydrolase [Candidatus Saccharibacteria bacterium]|nr:NUDIX hydrolase [Candidatus Saccharibacteria bacterium]HRK94463.1 NUDIX hydrolase [Candidatus Saccharibacteria bacterium]
MAAAKPLAKVVVGNNDGKYLILRSSEWPENPRRSLQPDLPGGVVEEGETPPIGAARELMEEAGLHVDPKDLHLVYDEYETHGEKHFRRFIYFIKLDNPDVKLSWEHDKFWWMSADEILKMKIREPYPALFKKLNAEKILV